MKFLEGAREFFTGKSKEEREIEKAKISEIRKEVIEAGFKARKEQAIRVAKEREVIAANRQLEQIRAKAKSSKTFGSGFFSGFSNYYGGVRLPQPTTRVSRNVRRKGRRKIITITKQVQAPAPRPHFDVLGGRGLFGV